MLECICMRTTVEIRDEQRVALAAIAARRGLRGYSHIVQEAIDAYLEKEDDLQEILALQGSITDAEAEEMRRRIDEAWATWRIEP
jgi:metal-responsive CopG/Arc/MetJ family transcriptional regulator